MDSCARAELEKSLVARQHGAGSDVTTRRPKRVDCHDPESVKMVQLQVRRQTPTLASGNKNRSSTEPPWGEALPTHVNGTEAPV